MNFLYGFEFPLRIFFTTRIPHQMALSFPLSIKFIFDCIWQKNIVNEKVLVSFQQFFR